MNKYKSILVLLLLSFNAQAQVYKCVVNGKTIFAERPCAANAKMIDTSGATVSTERHQQAQEVVKRERLLSEKTDLENRIDERARQRDQAALNSAKEAKKARCDRLVQTAKNAKDESNKWRYHQGLIDDAKRRQKEAEDAHFSECYGTVFSSN